MTACDAMWCNRSPPQAYAYCDDHHLLRDRSDDEPGDHPAVNDRSQTYEGRQ